VIASKAQAAAAAHPRADSRVAAVEDGGQLVLGRLASEFGAEGIGHDQPGIGREYLARHFDGRREKQPVAVRAIILPFLVGAEIGDRGFDLDDPQFAARSEAHQIGAAAGRQRQFAHHTTAVRVQQPRRTTRNGKRCFRLAAVDGQFE
jgi:hypothetical protein